MVCHSTLHQPSNCEPGNTADEMGDRIIRDGDNDETEAGGLFVTQV